MAEICDTLTRIGLGRECRRSRSVEGFHHRLCHWRQSSIRTPTACASAWSTREAAPVQVVCGALTPHRYARASSPVPAHTFPAKLTLGRGVIRGVRSLGMLCSAAELELSEDHDGIIELPDDAPVVAALASNGAGLSVIRSSRSISRPNRPMRPAFPASRAIWPPPDYGRYKTPEPSRRRSASSCPGAMSRSEFSPATTSSLCPQFALAHGASA